MLTCCSFDWCALLVTRPSSLSSDLPEEELKQDEQEENAEEKVA